jgi:hypothetical protein
MRCAGKRAIRDGRRAWRGPSEPCRSLLVAHLSTNKSLHGLTGSIPSIRTSRLAVCRVLRLLGIMPKTDRATRTMLFLRSCHLVKNNVRMLMFMFLITPRHVERSFEVNQVDS